MHQVQIVEEGVEEEEAAEGEERATSCASCGWLPYLLALPLLFHHVAPQPCHLALQMRRTLEMRPPALQTQSSGTANASERRRPKAWRLMQQQVGLLCS
jgi:hypothetical protein